jgi:ribonucleoside-diphosphate reductase alpha chain
MSLQYGVPLITLVDKFRHARFEPSGMTSNRDIPFAKSLIDYIFCWLGCQFIPGYADKNTPNRSGNVTPAENKNTTTAKQVVEKTKELSKKIAEAKAEKKVPVASDPKAGIRPQTKDKKSQNTVIENLNPKISPILTDRVKDSSNRLNVLVSTAFTSETEPAQAEAKMMQEFSSQFKHFLDDAPACDICGSITVRNGTCYKCFNCGNSMGCS